MSLPGLTLGVSAAAVLAVALTAFAAGMKLRRHKVADVAWGAGFAVVAVVALLVSAGSGLPGTGLRRGLLVGMTVVWGVRLAGHIFWRGRGAGEDPRYEAMLRGRGPLYVLATVYLGQGALIWLVSLPIQVGMSGRWAVAPLLVIGVALWLCGVLFEAVGDWQLERFKRAPANRGRIMDRGLWRYTRHPNYFGDACVWWGIFAVGCGSWAGLATVVSPLVMTYLLVWGSGKRLTEKRMVQSRPGYAEYAARTSGFIPRPPRRADAGDL